MINSTEILNARILIVDDREANVSLVAQILTEEGYTDVSTTTDSLEVCALHRKIRYDLIVLDLQMPGMDGFEVMDGLRADKSEDYLPVIALTAQPAHKRRALQAGARDFISKPFDLVDVTTRIHNMLEVRLLYKKLENYNKVLEQRTFHDIATGLPNRSLFDDRLTHAIALAKRHTFALAVMALDLDHFESLNDTHGHAVADGILKEVANRLLHQTRNEDTVCGSGRGEFLYLLMHPQSNENIERVARTLLETFQQPIDVGGLSLRINPSIGVAVYPEFGTTGEQLIRNAGNAMHLAKKNTMSSTSFNGFEIEGRYAGEGR
jgi:two-component system cell cycle response regulator